MRIMRKCEYRLSKSGWTARNLTSTGVDLDYEGKEFKRSQRLVRYEDGRVGYDWPEVVPPSIKRKVEALLERAQVGGE